MKDTLFRNEYGSLKDWASVLGVFLIILLAVILFIGFYVGMFAISDYYEVQAFNRIHGTDYTFGEWFWAEQTIKDYHLGPVENSNINLKIEGLDGLMNDK